MVAELTAKQAGETNLRKLVTVRMIDAIEPIDGADAIELAVVEGWKVVIKKGEFVVGDPCVYFEIDSFLPAGNPAWQFLVDKSGRDFEGVHGHRLRTVKLRGQISQGLVLKLDQVPDVMRALGVLMSADTPIENFFAVARQFDLAEALGIKKWEAPLPAELVGQALGLFPSFIRKTDQERCQNLVNDIFQYDDQKVPLDVAPELLDPDAVASGRVVVEDGKVYSLRAAKAHRDDQYEITMKVDGSSLTMFHRDGEVGVCSRNLQLKINEENSGNTFVKMLIDSELQEILPQLGNIAIQGELMGPAIQGNREQLKDFAFYVFEVQLLDEGRNATPFERYEIMDKLYKLGANKKKVRHVPIYADGKFVEFTSLTGLERIGYNLPSLNLTSVKDLLAFAEGPSITHQVREGLVFKRMDGKFSFKSISNTFLAKEKD